MLTLLAGPGVVWELAFGSWALLQPERINADAQPVIRTLQADEHQRGCLMEERLENRSPKTDIRVKSEFRSPKGGALSHWTIIRRSGVGYSSFGLRASFGFRFSDFGSQPWLPLIRNSKSKARWMEARDWLKRASDNGREPVWQIVFAGERFDVMGCGGGGSECWTGSEQALFPSAESVGGLAGGG